jgi:hypothetical protein
MLANLLKREAYFQIHGAPAIGPSRTDYGDRWQIYHGDFPASLPEAPGMCWAKPRKEKPGAFAPGGGNPKAGPVMLRAV